MRRILFSFFLIAASLAPATARGAGDAIRYREVAHQERGPCCDHFKWRAFVTDRSELRAEWERMSLRGDPPRIGFDRRVAVIAGTGGSSSCPPSMGGLRLNRKERRIVARIRIGAEGPAACTADWVPNTFVMAVPRDEVPRGELRVRVHRVSW